jgi:hypothetical protein
MLRRMILSAALIAVSLIALPSFAAILPDQLGTAAKTGTAQLFPPAADRPLYDEYGFEAGEQAIYGPLTVAAWRFKDSTEALAAYEYLRPADAKSSKLDKLAAQASHGAIVAHGNYVFQFTGRVPTSQELVAIYQGLPKLDQAALPVISTYLPSDGLIANSERYITGPVSLEKFDSAIPPSTAAFHMSAEAQYARYHSKNGDMNLAIFNYPTPSAARERAEAFQKIPGAIAKRTGSLVAVTIQPPDADAAERLLAKVNYQASITWNEKTETQVAQGFARGLLNIFEFAGLMVLFCLVSGVGFALIRVSWQRFGNKNADEAMITLHLQGK